MTTQVVLAFQVVFLVFAALASIMNPPANVPIFLASTAGSSTDVRKALSWRIALNVFIILVVSMFVGSYILDFFGLSLPVVQVGGGLLIMSFGWTFLHQREEDASAPSAQSWKPEELATRAFYPLTLPLTVGPGSMSIAIALGANTSQAGLFYVGKLVAMVTGVALVALSIYLCYRYAETIARVLGKTGTSVLLRLSAFIALCIGVQILWNGLTALIRAMPKG
jgi:multiple antibiotic resistance protein